MVPGIVVSVLVLLIFSCKKRDEPDFRDPFIGNYTFDARTYITNEQDSVYLDTSWMYNGSITKGEYSNTIYIQYFPSLKLIASLKDNGLVINGLDSILFGGFLGTDKINFTFRTKIFPTLAKKVDSVTGIKK